MGKLIRFDYAKKGKQDKKMCREQIKLIVNKHTVQNVNCNLRFHTRHLRLL